MIATDLNERFDGKKIGSQFIGMMSLERAAKES